MTDTAQWLPLNHIKRSPILQVRALAPDPRGLLFDEAQVQHYIELYRQDVDLGVLHATRLPDGELLLDDGFHRFEAGRRLGLESLPFIVEDGTLADAKIRACELNTGRGLTFGPNDRRKVARIYIQALLEKIDTYLLDGTISPGSPEALLPTDTEIARRLSFSRPTVTAAIAEIEAERDLPAARQITRAGRVEVQTRPGPRETTRDDLLDRDDAAAYEYVDPPALRPLARQTRPTRNNAPIQQTPLVRGETFAEPAQPSTPAPARQSAISVLVSYAYIDATGQRQQGTVNVQDLEQLPDAVVQCIITAVQNLSLEVAV